MGSDLYEKNKISKKINNIFFNCYEVFMIWVNRTFFLLDLLILFWRDDIKYLDIFYKDFNYQIISLFVKWLKYIYKIVKYGQ